MRLINLNRIWELWCYPWPLSRRALVSLGLILVCYSAILVYLGGLHTGLFGHDCFIFLDAGWRILTGQRPHIDFHTVLGPLQALYSAFGLIIGAGNVSIGFGIARALVTIVGTVWSFVLLRARVFPAAAIAMSLLITLLLGAPFALTSSPFIQSMAMFYNRFGYALILLIIFESFQPSRSPYTGGVSTGSALGLLLFLKVSFFGVALGFVVLSLLVCPSRLRRASGMACGFIAVVVPFLVWLRFDIAAILTDLRMGVLAKSAVFPMQRLVRTLNGSLVGILLTLSLGLIVTNISWNKKTIILENIRPIALALSAAVAETVIAISNQQDGVLIVMGTCCLVLLASMAKAPRRAESGSPVLSGAILILGLCVPLPGCIYDSMGIGSSLLHNIKHHDLSNIPRLDAPGLSSLVFERELSGPYKYENGPPLVNAINDGIHLVRANSANSDRVLTLGYINPFPVSLRRPSPRGSSIWFSISNNMGPGNHLATRELFAEAEVVMIPKFPTEETMTTKDLIEQYKDTLQSSYVLKAASDFWLLYRKRTRAQLE